jgi:predicted transposase YbfD/YdcC
VIAQTQVPDGTGENAAFAPLLDQIGDLDGKVITADALHTNAENARHVVDDHHGHYLLALKGNQPSIESTVKALPGGSFSP